MLRELCDAIRKGRSLKIISPYGLPKDEFVSITIYEMLGIVVNNLVSIYQSSGYKTVQLNALNNQG